MAAKKFLKVCLLSFTYLNIIFAGNNSVQANWFSSYSRNTKVKTDYKYKSIIRSFPRNLEINTIEVPWISKITNTSTSSEPNYITPFNVGNNKIPFTTSLAMSGGSFKANFPSNRRYPTSAFPFLSSGGVQTYSKRENCTGSLIGPGLVLTTASCFFDYGLLSDNPVTTDIHTDQAYVAVFVPGATNMALGSSSSGPIGFWPTNAVYINRNYLNGTCTNNETYTHCNLAILILSEDARDNSDLPGSHTTPFRYANGYGFVKGSSNSLNSGNNKIGQITTIGYSRYIGKNSNSAGLDMVRNDSIAMYYKPARNEPHLLYGSNTNSSLVSYEGQGSSIIVNFGTKYKSPAKANFPFQNILVGIQTVCSSEDTCIGTRFASSTDFPRKKYKDDDGKNWGPGHIGYAMRLICGTGENFNGSTYAAYCPQAQ